MTEEHKIERACADCRKRYSIDVPDVPIRECPVCRPIMDLYAKHLRTGDGFAVIVST